jgi:hypothetical protein
MQHDTCSANDLFVFPSKLSEYQAARSQAHGDNHPLVVHKATYLIGNRGL